MRDYLRELTSEIKELRSKINEIIITNRNIITKEIKRKANEKGLNVVRVSPLFSQMSSDLTVVYRENGSEYFKILSIVDAADYVSKLKIDSNEESFDLWVSLVSDHCVDQLYKLIR